MTVRSSPSVIVERFAVDDAVLNGLLARAFGGGEPAAWADQLDRHALTWFGAFHDGVLAGFVQVAWDGGQHAFILDTAVDPARQRQGLGEALVRAATAAAAKAGCRWLHVDHEPHLDTFYRERCGFRPTLAGLIDLGQRSDSQET